MSSFQKRVHDFARCEQLKFLDFLCGVKPASRNSKTESSSGLQFSEPRETASKSRLCEDTGFRGSSVKARISELTGEDTFSDYFIAVWENPHRSQCIDRILLNSRHGRLRCGRCGKTALPCTNTRQIDIHLTWRRTRRCTNTRQIDIHRSRRRTLRLNLRRGCGGLQNCVTRGDFRLPPLPESL